MREEIISEINGFFEITFGELARAQRNPLKRYDPQMNHSSNH